MNKLKLIVADDQIEFLGGLVGKLKEVENFEIVGLAYNGEDLLNLLNTTPADIIITDNKMPKITGLEVIKEYVKGKTTLPLIYIISGDSIERECLNLDISLIKKPISIDRILDIIISDINEQPKEEDTNTVNQEIIPMKNENLFKKFIKKIKQFIKQT
jgi:YesN/AraC family two-component response regulator